MNEDDMNAGARKSCPVRMRIMYEQQGGHYHCRVSTCFLPGETFALCGSIVFDEREWPFIQAMLPQVEFREVQ